MLTFESENINLFAADVLYFLFLTKMSLLQIVTLILPLLGWASAQQFAQRITPYQYMGLLSETCVEALNTTVECAYQLAKHQQFE